MDRNTLIALAATAALFFGWQWYLDQQYPERHERPPSIDVESTAKPSDETPADYTPVRPGAEPATPPAASELSKTERRVSVERAGYKAELSTRGGVLTSWVLSEYDDASLPSHPNIQLVTGERALETPLEGITRDDLSTLDYDVARPSADVVEFATSVESVVIRKTYRFEPSGYGARLTIAVDNQSSSDVTPDFAVHWRALRAAGAEFNEFNLTGYATDDVERFAIAPLPSALGFGGGPADEDVVLAPVEREAFELDWAGVETRYFVAAILPDKPREARARFRATNPGSEARLEIHFEPVRLPPGTKLQREYRLYLGPKEPDRLDEFGAHLDEAIQKGWAPSLTRIFTTGLTLAHEFVPNYGLAIILLTVLLRVAMAPLMVGQMRSMKRMADLAPKLKVAQDRFPDDRAKQQEAMMAVYQQAGVSPFSAFGGCLPMLLQLPVFVGFYFALQSSILLRQQPFFGWINDLSQPESLFVIPGIDLHVRFLPLALGVAMWAQQRLTPTPGMDPAQARMMQILMPVMMTLMFYQFAAGLGLYWLASTLLGIAQQQWMNRSKPVAA